MNFVVIEMLYVFLFVYGFNFLADKIWSVSRIL